MTYSQVPGEFRSTSPFKLRELVSSRRSKLNSDVVALLLEVAAEIEGGEDAFGAVVEENRELREKLFQMQKNLSCAHDLIRDQGSRAGQKIK